MNHSLMTADRTTHLKMVVLALIAGIGVVLVGLSARDPGASTTASLKTEQIVVKAGTPSAFTSRDITVR